MTVADLEKIDLPLLWDYFTTYHNLTNAEEFEDTANMREANLPFIQEMYEAGELSEEDYLEFIGE